MYGATLTGADLDRTDLSGADLRGTRLAKANMGEANLSGARLDRAHLAGANLRKADLSAADLDRAKLAAADLSEANLSGAAANEADLAGASLHRANLSGAALVGASLAGADLQQARLTVETNLTETILTTTTLLADVVWNGAPLARVAWEALPVLGDEVQACQPHNEDGTQKSADMRLSQYQAAVRAYRLLAVMLRSQGLNEQADRFAYRAQLMQRVVLRRQAFLRQHGKRRGPGRRFRKVAAYGGSGLLDLIAGYGYRPFRSFVTYITTIALFALCYWCVTNHVSLTHGLFTQGITWLGMQPPTATAGHLQGYEAVVVSMTSFHGRGFFLPAQTPGDKVGILAAVEAAIGLLLEITFIATFTQRFFAR